MSRIQRLIQVPVHQSRVPSIFTQVTELIPETYLYLSYDCYLWKHQKRLVFLLHLALFLETFLKLYFTLFTWSMVYVLQFVFFSGSWSATRESWVRVRSVSSPSHLSSRALQARIEEERLGTRQLRHLFHPRSQGLFPTPPPQRGGRGAR